MRGESNLEKGIWNTVLHHIMLFASRNNMTDHRLYRYILLDTTVFTKIDFLLIQKEKTIKNLRNERFCYQFSLTSKVTPSIFFLVFLMVLGFKQVNHTDAVLTLACLIAYKAPISYRVTFVSHMVIPSMTPNCHTFLFFVLL